GTEDKVAWNKNEKLLDDFMIQKNEIHKSAYDEKRMSTLKYTADGFHHLFYDGSTLMNSLKNIIKLHLTLSSMINELDTI
ncbi:MAG: hypothetical protein ACPG5P_07240, partial [Saprospiraceae bacterium]